MVNENLIIGLEWGSSYQVGGFITLKDLKEKLPLLTMQGWSIRRICDWRYTTFFQRFRFDPFTGEEIPWKQIKREYGTTNSRGSETDSI